MTVDKENVIPGLGEPSSLSGKKLTMRLGSSSIVAQKMMQEKKKAVFSPEDFENSNVVREKLVAEALKKGSSAASFEQWFKHDLGKLIHMAPEQCTKMEIRQIQEDTKSLENASYSKLRAWLALARYFEQKMTPGCVRLVFEKMASLGIAKYYKEFYEEWAAFEMRSGSSEKVKEVAKLAVQNKVYDGPEVVNIWAKKFETEVDADETLAFNSTAALGRRDSNGSEKAEPTVVLNDASNPKRSLRRAASNLKSGKRNKALRAPQPKLTKIGRAVRVVKGEDDNDKDRNESLEREDLEQRPIMKEKILEKIGDVSYITNWTPEMGTNTRRKESNLSSTMSSSGQKSDGTTEEVTQTMQISSAVAGATGNSSVLKDTITFNERSRQTPTETPRHLSRPNLPPELQGFHDSLFSNKNSFMVNGKPYLRLAVIGRGGSSKVFKVLSVGEAEPQIYALKRIKLQRADPSSLSSFMNEISLLQRLRGNPHIITLIDSEIDKENKVIYVVMEHGEIDLNSLLQRQRKEESVEDGTSFSFNSSGMVGNLSVNFIRLIWMNMLQAVHAIHEERIVHGDLKPANFIFVKGKLKLIDFGIAKAISNDTTNIMRETQVGTLNFMSPESIIDINSVPGSRPKIGAPGMKLKQGRASDIWSMGCILYLMIYGHTPFHDLKLVQKIHCISDPNYKIPFPKLNEGVFPDLVDAAKQCLQFDPRKRPPIVDLNGHGLLSHPFLNPGSRKLEEERAPPKRETLKKQLFTIIDQVCTNAAKLEELKEKDPERIPAIVSTLVDNLIETEDNDDEDYEVDKEASPEPARLLKRSNRVKRQPPMSQVKEESTAEIADTHVATERAPLSKPRLASSLQESITSGRAALKPVSKSDASKYMKPKEEESSGGKDLASLLRNGLEAKRKVIESQDNTIEAIIRSGTTWEFLGED